MKRLLTAAGWMAMAAHAVAATAQDSPDASASAAAPAAQPAPEPLSPAGLPEAAAAPSPTPAPARTMVLQMPLVDSNRVFNDVLVSIAATGEAAIDRQSLIDTVAPLLRADARSTFEAALPASGFIPFAALTPLGVELRYDSSRLEVVIERIDPTMREVELLGFDSGDDIPITAQPEDFSIYTNITADLTAIDFETVQSPAVLAFGAARYGDFVLEYDGGYDKNLTGGRSGFYRRQARLVYDQYDKLRRFSAGDLQLSGLPIAAGAFIGGVAVEKGRRIFNALTPLTSLGTQQFLLDRDATLEVLVDGQQVETLQLNAGAYDLGQLRAQYAGTNAQLFITDISGRRQITDFDTYTDQVDLAAGEDEYSAAIGMVADDFLAGPQYGTDPGFTGFYRRALTNRLIVGGSLQVSEDVQMGAGEVIVSPRTLPGRFELSAAASTGNGLGYALRGAYSLQAGGLGQGSQLTFSADYRSARFSTLADALAIFDRAETLNITASYIRYFNEKTSVLVGLNWFDRQNSEANRVIFADLVHRTRRFRFTAGLEYGRGLFARDFGVRLGITVPFGRQTRADATYNSRRDDFRAFVQKGLDDQIGSYGYNLAVRKSNNTANVDGAFDYNGNRFNSRLVVTSGGNGFSNIDEQQQARLQVGTSIAYTGGNVAIGRPIADSFIIAKPHESISDEQVVVGRSVRSERFDAVSGTFGPALGSRLQSYTRQTVVYDLRDGPTGYDIGSGIETLFPTYRSGYHLVVGSDASVSAYGFLTVDGARAVLLAGTITSPDDAEFGRQAFFTNSAGRFAMIGLRPGKTYVVEASGSGATFTISVPQDAQALQQLGEISVSTAPQGE